MKKYRFFYHYNKFTGRMTVHYRKECIPVDDVICTAPTETKWNKSQPRLVVQGWTTGIMIKDKTAYIL